LDQDDASSVDLLTNFMRRKELPHGLVRFNAEESGPCIIKQFIKEGLQYDMKSRPTTIKICCDLREVTKEVKS
jgi:hypothetical protein